jgi:hypothetical protein
MSDETGPGPSDETAETTGPTKHGLDWQYAAGFGLVLVGVLAFAWALRQPRPCADCAEKHAAADDILAGQIRRETELLLQESSGSVGGDDEPFVGAPVDPNGLVVAEPAEH